MPRVEIDKDTPLEPGDRIILTFKSSAWIWSQSVEIAAIEAYCDRREDFMICSFYFPEPKVLEVEIDIKNKYMDQPEGSQPQEYQRASLAPAAAAILVTAVKVAAVIIGASLLLWLALIKAEKVVKSGVDYVETKAEEMKSTVGGQIALGGIGAAGVAILLAVIGKYLKILK